MTRYANLGGDSGVVTYESGPDCITVGFHDGSQYLYIRDSAGTRNIEQMKGLAEAAQGLNEFINRYVKKRYARKSR